MVTKTRRFSITQDQDNTFVIALHSRRYRLGRIEDWLRLEALDDGQVAERLEFDRRDGTVRGSLWHRSGAFMQYTVEDDGRHTTTNVEVDGIMYRIESPQDAFTANLAEGLKDVQAPPMNRIIHFGMEVKADEEFRTALTPKGAIVAFSLSPTCATICDAAESPGLALLDPAAAALATAACIGCRLQDLGI